MERGDALGREAEASDLGGPGEKRFFRRASDRVAATATLIGVRRGNFGRLTSVRRREGVERSEINKIELPWYPFSAQVDAA